MLGHARNVMTERVTSVTPDTPLVDLGRLMVDGHYTGLPVLDADERVVGFVSETDLLGAFLRGAPEETTASEVMSLPPIVVDEFMATDDVLALMREKRIHHLPVVRSGKLVGIITPHDVLAYCVQRMFPPPSQHA